LVAETLGVLPIGVGITPPSAQVEDCPFTTSSEFLQSILHNLIKNSVEAMPAGGEIRIEALRQEDLLLVDVQDTGPGLRSELIQQVLAGEPINSTKREGSGLGLLTVYGMLKRINGSLSGTSTPGRGMTWMIELRQLPTQGAEVTTAEEDE